MGVVTELSPKDSNIIDFAKAAARIKRQRAALVVLSNSSGRLPLDEGAMAVPASLDPDSLAQENTWQEND
jgi:hypothetical protein